MSRYGTSEENAWSMLVQIPIVHVHGDLGALPLQPDKMAGERPYEPTRDSQHIISAAERISIMSSAHIDSNEFKRARGFLLSAERMYFLGFGYHDDNMRRLGFENGKGFGRPSNMPTIIGTAYNISGPNRTILNRKFPNVGLCRPTGKSLHFWTIARFSSRM